MVGSEQGSRRQHAQLRLVAPMFAALGEPRRLEIVSRLCSEGPQSIVRLTAGTDVSRQAITKHLRLLEGAGLVCSAREGRERVWRVREEQLADVRRSLDRISDQWDDAIERLRAAVEGPRQGGAVTQD